MTALDELVDAIHVIAEVAGKRPITLTFVDNAKQGHSNREKTMRTAYHVKLEA